MHTVHTYVDIELHDVYYCSTHACLMLCNLCSSKQWHLYFLDPVSIGYDVPDAFTFGSFIIPDGNVINNFLQLVIPRRKRGLLLFISVTLNCYTTRGHENPIWIIPDNSSFGLALSTISPYRSVLHINNISPDNSLETFVCQSSNNTNSSVIVTSSKSTFIYRVKIYA